jgi:hypothetical protein
MDFMLVPFTVRTGGSSIHFSFASKVIRRVEIGLLN